MNGSARLANLSDGVHDHNLEGLSDSTTGSEEVERVGHSSLKVNSGLMLESRHK